jgi:two-component system, NarL family, sensor kinase
LKQHATTAPGSIQADYQKWPVVSSEQRGDQLYWMVATDYLFAVRVLPGRTFSYETINPAFASIFGVSSNDMTLRIAISSIPMARGPGVPARASCAS